MIKSKKRVETKYTLEFDEQYAEQLRLWLKWAFTIWQQMQYRKPFYETEIVNHWRGSTAGQVAIESLSHDKLLVFLNRLDSPNEVEEV